MQSIYVFNDSYRGNLNLKDCQVVLNDSAEQISMSGGNLVNNGHISRLVRMGGSSTAQTGVIYRDRVVEKPVYRNVYVTDPKQQQEISRLKKRIRELNIVVKELKNGVDSDAQNECTLLRSALSQKDSKLDDALRRNAELEENLAGVLEANREQARRIMELEKEKTVIAPKDEYEPNRNDIRMMTRNLHLFLGCEDNHTELI